MRVGGLTTDDADDVQHFVLWGVGGGQASVEGDK